MAKALLGAVGSTDPRMTARLRRENDALRLRLADLEAMVLRLQAENDELQVAAAAVASTPDPVDGPVSDEVLEPA